MYKRQVYNSAVGSGDGGKWIQEHIEHKLSLIHILFGTVFWDYSGFKFNLGGRINLLYCFFWGIAAVIWICLLYTSRCV